VSPSTPWLDYEHIRIRMVMAAMLATFVFLGTFMWWFQVARGHQFEYDLEKQSVRRVRLPGLRGRIFDRNDICLADNRPSYGIALYLEEIRQRGRRTRMADQVETIVQQLSETLRLEPSLTRDEINAHIRRRLPLPLVAWRDIDEATLARFSEQAALFPGVDIVVDAQRIYPLRTRRRLITSSCPSRPATPASSAATTGCCADNRAAAWSGWTSPASATRIWPINPRDPATTW
jgi:cell division protein FtsI/penicillin-binding protein 2